MSKVYVVQIRTRGKKWKTIFDSNNWVQTLQKFQEAKYKYPLLWVRFTTEEDERAAHLERILESLRRVA